MARPRRKSGVEMSGYIPWGHIIAAVLLIGIAATICFVMGAREMGDPDDSPDPHTLKNIDFDDLH